MKMMRLMAATALAVGTVTGALVESAEAQRIGNSYSPRNGTVDDIDNDPANDTLRQVDRTFVLFQEDPNGQLILDSDDSDSIGIFERVIEDFNIYNRSITVGSDESPLDSIDFDPITRRPVGFTEGDIDVSLDFATLEARQVIGSSAIAEELGLSEGQVGSEFPALIVYSFSTDQEEFPEEEFPEDGFLFVDQPTLNDISNVLGARGAENVVFPSPIFDENDVFDIDAATNSIETIFSNSLLGLTVDQAAASAIVTGNSPFASLDDFDAFITEGPLRNFIVLDETFTVPEPGTTTTLLALGALGVGLGLKRKLK